MLGDGDGEGEGDTVDDGKWVLAADGCRDCEAAGSEDVQAASTEQTSTAVMRPPTRGDLTGADVRRRGSSP